MPRILVTGGRGFIGSHISSFLTTHGYEVIRFDIRNGTNGGVQGDVRNINELNTHIPQCDGIIHLAAVSRVIWGEEHPELCKDINENGISNILESIRRQNNRPWLIFGSSREVYGEAKEYPVSESFMKKPINVYGKTKLFGERICEKYNQEYGIDVGILRFSNVYGGSEDQLGRVIPKWIMRSIVSESISINGKNLVFDFTHIDDTINGIYGLIGLLEEERKNSYFDDFHILTGQPTSLESVAGIIDDQFEEEIKTEYSPRRNYDVDYFYGNPEKAFDAFGYKPSVMLQEGISKTVDIYRNEYDHLCNVCSQEPWINQLKHEVGK